MKAMRFVLLGLSAAWLVGCSSQANFEGPAAYEKSSTQEKIARIKNAALSPEQKAQAVDNLELSAEEKAKVKAEIAAAPPAATPMGQPAKGG